MAAPSAAAEAAVKKLARIGGNTICPNCGTEKKFGFGTVCMKFLTFVCNECKSSHQAISHRCKSLTMSSWTEGEVLQLRTLGGNDRARATWLATAPLPGQNGRPMPGSSIDVYKSFIVEVYERKKYYKEAGSVNDVGLTNTSSQQRLQPPTLPAANSLPQQHLEEPNPRHGAQLSSPPVEVDLLDFGAFDTAAATAPLQASSSISAVGPHAPQAASFDPFGMSGGSNASNIHDFGAFNSVANSSVSNGTGVVSFDPFGSASTAVPLSLDQRKTPIMNNSTANGARNIGTMSSHSTTAGMMHNGFHPSTAGMMQNGLNPTNAGMMQNGLQPTNAGMMHNGFGGSNMYLHGMPSYPMGQSATGFSYHQQPIMHPSMNNGMMMNTTNNPGQPVNYPGIMNSTMTMNGATNMGNYSGTGSVMMQNGMRNPGGMVMNVMPGGNSMNRISTNFDGKSQQTAKPDPFANLGL